MLHIVEAFSRIGEENAFAVLARATELQRQGKDIINLGIGQPDFRTPENIVEAAIKAGATTITPCRVAWPSRTPSGPGMPAHHSTWLSGVDHDACRETTAG